MSTDDVGVAGHVLPRSADERVALVDRSRGGARRWTYAELTGAVAALAGRLRDAGVAEGDVVAVLVENSAEFVVAYHGVLTAGAVVLPLDPRGVEAEWAADLTRCQAKAIVLDPGLWRGAPRPGKGVFPVADLASGQATGVDVPTARGGDRPAVLLSSSGTQGTPKKVVITHRNLTAGLEQIERVHRIGEGEVVTCVGPLRHIYGMQMAMNAVLRARGTLVIGSIRFDLADFLARLVEDRTAVAYVVPSVVAGIAALPDPPVPPSLRLVVSGGAPLPAPAGSACADALGVPVVQGFGMTEAGCVSFTPDDRPGPAGTVGVVLPGTQARFVDPRTGQDVPGGPGELWLRGPQVAAGHLDGEAGVVALRDADGWFRTGDLAVLDAHGPHAHGPDGYLRIVGRLKSLIKYKGHQVSPAELEEVLVSHPAVADALVVGEPDPVAGELPKAYVVVTGKASLAEITRHVAERVSPHKRVRLVERVHEIPRSATGKPVRPPAVRVLVTGGGRGLGREFATALAGAGASVLVVGRDPSALADTAALAADARGRIGHAVADVTDPAALAAAVKVAEEAYGGVDVLVNNAADPGPLGPTWKVDADRWWRAFEVNLRGAETATRLVTPGLVARGGGRIVTVVSRAGRLRWPHASAYAVSKAALISLTANLDGELRGTGVSAIAFDPGLLDIGMTRAHLDRGHIGDPHADGILDLALRARDSGGFTPVDQAAAALVRIAAGAADHLSGRCVEVEDVLGQG